MIRSESPGFRGKIDWAIVAAAVGLVLIGSIAILSAASPMPRYPQILQRHFLAVVLGLISFLVGFGFNYQIFQDQARNLYLLMIFLMISVLFVGQTIRGHRSWIRLPYFAFQPSEVARIATVFVLANFLDRRGKQIDNVTTVLGATAIVLPIAALIVIQPDFSSAIIFFPVLIAMLFCAGANLGQLVAMAACGAVTVGLVLLWTLLSLRPELAHHFRFINYFVALSESNFLLATTTLGIFASAYVLYRLLLTMRFRIPWIHFLVTASVLVVGLYGGTLINRHIKYYQRNRFLAFVAPEADPQEAGYNVNQALVAIGSGGIMGKGIFSGTQSQLGFLPERHTDFIFAVIGEEMGFVGSVIVLGLYLLLMWRLVHAARIARDRYGYLICSGLGAMFGFYVLVNVGMCLGLLPVAGLPLPLISYGGSSLVANLWAIGVVENVYSKRYAFM